MPFRPPGLDDRRYEDLVNELLARIPAHTPEWTNPRPGDPGRTLIELFAWLGDALLYRANLIPERQRMAFLALLGEQLRPARPARTVITVGFDDANQTQAVVLRPQATVKGPVNFETLHELTVLPVAAEIYYKRRLADDEAQALAPIVDGLRTVYGLDRKAQPYTTAPVFAGGAAEPGGFDPIARAVDRCLWFALLAPKPELVDAVRTALGKNSGGGAQLLSIGVMPAVDVPALFEAIGPRARIPHLWEVCASLRPDGSVEYAVLDVVEDTSLGLTRRGVIRLALPAGEFMQAPKNDVRLDFTAGVGDKPPRLDDPEKAARLVTWLRLRPLPTVQRLPLAWAGVNAVEIDQRQTLTGRIVGQSDGSGGQQFQLPGGSVDAATLQLQVEEPGLGYRLWQRIDDLALAGRDDAVYSIDAEAGIVRFGDGVRGRVPPAESRVRVAVMRSGGGAAGNLPPGALTAISAVDLSNKPVARLKVQQPLAADGGEDRETLAEAEQRVPALFRHRDRCVTGDDYKRLAADTPGVRVGRVDLLPRFRPQQRQAGVAGVVSVMVLPFQPAVRPPNPRPDRPFLETVHAWLDERRPLGTELYVIGCEYVPLGVSVGVAVAEGAGRETVLNDVREGLRRFLWPLTGGGIQGTGWPLGAAVRERELEVAVARVAGVVGVRGLLLFRREGDGWRRIAQVSGNAELALESWQLPELLSVVAVADADAPDNLSGVPNPFADAGIAVPVVPEMCK
jgi:predicted phage baseplate assembly protein